MDTALTQVGRVEHIGWSYEVERLASEWFGRAGSDSLDYVDVHGPGWHRRIREREGGGTGVQGLFHALKQKWVEETGTASSTMDMVMHPCYQRIIGLGPEVVKYILADLREEPNYWFWALEAVTGEQQAAQGDNFEAARQKWLAWGIRQGLIADATAA